MLVSGRVLVIFSQMGWVTTNCESNGAVSAKTTFQNFQARKALLALANSQKTEGRRGGFKAAKSASDVSGSWNATETRWFKVTHPLSPNVGGPLNVQEVTFSPSQKGHKELPGILRLMKQYACMENSEGRMLETLCILWIGNILTPFGRIVFKISGRWRVNPAKMYAWKMVIYNNSVSASRRVVLT